MKHAIDQAADRCPETVEQTVRLICNSLEYGLDVIWRAGYHLQDVGSRRLPFQAFLRLVEQPCILDCDHRLVGKGFDQLDMLRTKCPRLLPRDIDHPDNTTRRLHWRQQNAAVAARSRDVPDTV